MEIEDIEVVMLHEKRAYLELEKKPKLKKNVHSTIAISYHKIMVSWLEEFNVLILGSNEDCCCLEKVELSTFMDFVENLLGCNMDLVKAIILIY